MTNINIDGQYNSNLGLIDQLKKVSTNEVKELKDSYIRNILSEDIIPEINNISTIANTTTEKFNKTAHIENSLQIKVTHSGASTGSGTLEGNLKNKDNLTQNIFEVYLLHINGNSTFNVILGSFWYNNNIVQIYCNNSTNPLSFTYRYSTTATNDNTNLPNFLAVGNSGNNTRLAEINANVNLYFPFMVLRWIITTIISSSSVWDKLYNTDLTVNSSKVITSNYITTLNENIKQEYITYLGKFKDDSLTNIQATPGLLASYVILLLKYVPGIPRIFMYELISNGVTYKGLINNYIYSSSQYLQVSIINGNRRFRIIDINGASLSEIELMPWIDYYGGLSIGNDSSNNKVLKYTYIPELTLFESSININDLVNNSTVISELLSDVEQLKLDVAELKNYHTNINTGE